MSKIAFVHPDLGIGGAERLVVDAAVGLQDLGNEITIYTSHCDKTHCFEEVGSGQLKVAVYGDFLPTHVLRKFHILFAILRQFYLVARLILTGEISKYDYFIVDQLSFAVPILSVFSRPETKILFYCHFPDQLLAKKGGLAKKMYRIPFDAIEEWTTGVSDQIVVNSTFTKSIFHKTFTNLALVDPGVIYPCVDVKQAERDNSEAESELRQFMKQKPFFLSINRFERLKNIELAIGAFSQFKKSLPLGIECPRLVLSGGYDARVSENVEYLKELESLCNSLDLKHVSIRGRLVVMPPSTEVMFLPSVKTSLKNALLKAADLLLYTPTFEHFGIVPVESMLSKTPVLAINRGGPLESIVSYDGNNSDKATGFNRPNDVDQWADILTQFYVTMDEDTKLNLGENGRVRAQALFSRDQMSEQFQAYLKEASKRSAPKGSMYSFLQMWKVWVSALVVVALVIGGKAV